MNLGYSDGLILGKNDFTSRFLGGLLKFLKFILYGGRDVCFGFHSE